MCVFFIFRTGARRSSNVRRFGEGNRVCEASGNIHLIHIWSHTLWLEVRIQVSLYLILTGGHPLSFSLYRFFHIPRCCLCSPSVVILVDKKNIPGGFVKILFFVARKILFFVASKDCILGVGNSRVNLGLTRKYPNPGILSFMPQSKSRLWLWCTYAGKPVYKDHA